MSSICWLRQLPYRVSGQVSNHCRREQTQLSGWPCMRLKLKYVLPLVQTLLAVALLVWTDHWERALMRIQDMPGTPPSFTLLIAINAPLALPRARAFRYLPGGDGWWDDITLVLAIWVFWHWVALSIESWQRGRHIAMFSWVPLRLVTDVTAIGIGVMWAFLLLHSRSSYSLPPLLSWTDWLWFVPCICLPILWSAVLIILFGRDFVSCLRHHKTKSDSLRLT